MTTTVAVDRSGAAGAIWSSIGLAVAAALTILAPVVGVARASDDSDVWFASGALWIACAPAVLVAVLAGRWVVAALGAAAGCGVMGLARLLSDLPVVFDPDSVARPDLYVETTDRTLPFHSAPGGYLLLAADLVTLAVGIAAARRLSSRVDFTDRSDRDEAAGKRNSAMLGVGFVGVLLMTIGALGVRYQGGYLAARYVAVGVPLWGLAGAVVLAVLAALAVVTAGSLPRSTAVALLGGIALGASVPGLVAVIAVLTAPVDLSQTVWLGLAGAVVTVGAGLLTRTVESDATASSARSGSAGTTDRRGPGLLSAVRPRRAVTVVAGIAGLGAAVLCVLAAVLPLIDAGGLEDLLVLTDGSPIPGVPAFWWAAALMAVAGAVTLVSGLASVGRTALLVSWSAVAVPLTLALDLFADGGIATARALALVSVGPGTWCAIAAGALAVMAAVLAAIGVRRAGQSQLRVVDDERRGRNRMLTTGAATCLVVLTLVADGLPVYHVGRTSGPTLLDGYTVQVWGVWAVCLATIGALIAACVTRRAWVITTLGIVAGAVQATRLVPPSYAGSDLQVAFGAGAVSQAVLIVLLIVAGAILALRALRRH